MTKYIFVTGGVVSSLGKGLAAASLGVLLQARGFSVRLRKLDPYLNMDPGTMSPYQHGEVFVTNDGTESDLDLGHYERFTNVDARRSDSITTGQIYSTVLAKERRGDYLGATVQVVPHIIDEIKAFITAQTEGTDIIICEIGGTVGDIEGLPYLEAIRQMRVDFGPDHTLFLHSTLVPYIAAAGELKTKPTQHSVKELLSFGIQPDILLCRTEHPIPEEARRKIGLFCNVRADRVIQALDARNIYEVPLHYHAEGLDAQVCRYFGLPTDQSPDLGAWQDLVDRVENPHQHVKIAIVGKYVQLKDAYKSLWEALVHAGAYHRVKVELSWVDADDANQLETDLVDVHGIVVPGGFGERGSDGKIEAVKCAREKGIPFFGICFGMQLAVVEAARHLAGLSGASSTEFGPTDTPVVAMMTEWMSGDQLERRSQFGDLGGTMRLGAYTCHLKPGSLASKIYAQTTIQERHRHRYEVNTGYRDILEKAGLIFSGLSPDGELPEIIERTDHPWFLAVQFHPELKSRPFVPHPLFVSFVEAAIGRAQGSVSS